MSMRLHINACIYIAYMHYECLFYACVCMFTYDVMIMILSLKVICFGIYVLKSLKLNLCMFTAFIIKPKMAGTLTMTQCLSSRNPTEKSSISHSYVSCGLHSVSGTMEIFIKLPVWHWCFDPVLNAL